MVESGERTPSTSLPMFNRILLVTDFSVFSEAASPFAHLLANLYRADLRVVHVVQPETEGAQPSSADVERRDAETRLQNHVRSTPLGEVVSEAIVGYGKIWEVIAETVAAKQIDLIVLGTHGRSGVGKLLLGSVAQQIFSQAPCPVVSVSPRARGSWDGDRKVRRVLFATNFSDTSLNALPYALSLAKVSGAELILLHAVDSEDELRSELAQGYHEHLNALIPREEKAWCKSDTLVTAGDPARVIVDAAAAHEADFIVIGAHATGGSMATFQVPLSTAYRVVAHAPCPVLRVRS